MSTYERQTKNMYTMHKYTGSLDPSSDVSASTRSLRGDVGGWREREKERGGQQKDALGTVPILLVKLQHHVVRGDA